MKLFENYHTYIVLILLVVSVVSLGFKITEHFPVAHHYIKAKNDDTPFANIFNIDTMIKEQPQNLGWKKEWRDNYSKFDVELDNSFKGSAYTNFSTHNKLLYDGIRDVSCTRV